MSAPPPPPRWHFLAALTAITFIAPLAIHMYLPALPAVRAQFAVSVGTAQLTLSLVMFTMAFVTVIYGGLSDRLGRRPVLLGGLALYALGAELAWFAPDISVLLAGRLLQGSGAGCGVVLARAIVRDVYGMDRVAQVIAYLTAAYVLGPLVAPPLGGFLVDTFGWRALFAVAAGAGLALIVLVYLLIPETRQTRTGPRRPGGVAASYWRLLRNPRFTGFALQPGFLSGAFFAQATAVSFLAIEVLEVPPREFGLWFLLFATGFMSGNFISGRIGARRSIEVMTITGSLVSLATTLALIGLLSFAPMTMATLTVPGFFIGIGQGLCLPYAQAGAMAVEPDLAGSASGAVVFSQLFFAALLQQLAGVLADGTWVPMAMIMLGATVCSLVAGLVAVRARPPRRVPAAG